MFDLSRREKKLINICIYMLIFILYYNFYLSYVLKDVYSIYGNIKSYNLKIQNISNIKEDKKKDCKYKNNKIYSAVSNIAYEDTKSSSIASTLKVMADSSKIQIKELFFNDISKDECTYDELKVSIISVKAYAIGDYSSLIEFIEKINKQKFCSINNVIIKRQNNTMQLNIDMNYYITYKEDDKGATKK